MAKRLLLKIVRNGASPIIPTDSSVFIGDFPHNGTVTCRYKVAISSEAEKQTYPVDVVVMYENRDGDVVTSASETIGIPVGGKTGFAITSGTVQVVQGSQSVIQVEYQNNGTTIAYHSQARLSAVEPFKSSDDTAYLGDLKPGEKATAHYQISVDDAAVAKEYTLDTEVRYRDALDNSQVSDTFQRASPGSGKTGIGWIDAGSGRYRGYRPDWYRRRVLFTCNAKEEVMLGWEGGAASACGSDY